MLLLLCRDLLLSSKITAEARALGIPITLLRNPADLASAPPARKLILDLNLDGEDNAIEAAAAYKCRTQTPILAFVSHVDGQTISSARSAGLTSDREGGDRILARSAFFADIKSFLE
jgi:hypothetical protein